jgi:hypothetical protein
MVLSNLVHTPLYYFGDDKHSRKEAFSGMFRRAPLETTRGKHDLEKPSQLSFSGKLLRLSAWFDKVRHVTYTTNVTT